MDTTMFCPQCATKASGDQRYCRSCGANLRIIGKALTLGEALARSDRGPLPALKEMMKKFSLDQATDEVARAFEQMNREIVKGFDADKQIALKSQAKAERREKERWAAEQKRERNIVKGLTSLFSGIGLMIFLYFFANALVLKVPPEQLAKIPFELAPAVKMAWLIGLIPALGGLGRAAAGFMVHGMNDPYMSLEEHKNRHVENVEPVREIAPPSVTEHTTRTLDRVQ